MQDFGHGFFMSPETYAELSKASSALGRLEPAHESVPDMFAALRAPRLVLIDVRSNLTGDAAAARASFAAAHVPGARFLSFEAVFTSPRTAESGRHPWPAASHVREALVAFGVLPEDRLVFVDEGAMTFAARALLCARLAGYPDCAVLEGGLTRWRALGLPTETGLVEALAEKHGRRLLRRPRGPASSGSTTWCATSTSALSSFSTPARIRAGSVKRRATLRLTGRRAAFRGRSIGLLRKMSTPSGA